MIIQFDSKISHDYLLASDISTVRTLALIFNVQLISSMCKNSQMSLM